jgi:hypothetical protein
LFAILVAAVLHTNAKVVFEKVSRGQFRGGTLVGLRVLVRRFA